MDWKKALERQTYTGGQLQQAARSDDLASLHRAAVGSYADEVATLRKHISGAIDGQDVRSHYEKLMQDDPRRLLPADLSRFDGTLRADADRVGMTSGYEVPNYVDATAERMLKSMAPEEKMEAMYSISEDEIKAAEERGRRSFGVQQLEVLPNPALDGFARDYSRHQAREDAKVEFARRSAEASEEVLAEERRKRQAAELAAKQAEIEKGIADERADRAERRETRMVRLAIIGLFGTVASLALAAWPFL